MSRNEHFVVGARQSPSFDNAARLASYKQAKYVPGTEAPVLFANPKGRYVPNPFAAHIPPPVKEEFEDGSVRYHQQHGIPGYDPTATFERPRRVEQVPLDRLESTQNQIDRRHVSNMGRRKGTPPPIDVVHHVDQDRYVIEEGNHRATLALTRGETHVPARVTRRRTS